MQLWSEPRGTACAQDLQSGRVPSGSNQVSSVFAHWRRQDRCLGIRLTTQSETALLPEIEKPLAPSILYLLLLRSPQEPWRVRPPGDISRPFPAFPVRACRGAQHPEHGLLPNGCVLSPHRRKRLCPAPSRLNK